MKGTKVQKMKQAVARLLMLVLVVGTISVGGPLVGDVSTQASTTYTKAKVNKEIKKLQKEVKSLKAKDKKQKTGLVKRNGEIPTFMNTSDSHVVFYMDDNMKGVFFWVNGINAEKQQDICCGNAGIKVTSGTRNWEGHSCKVAKYVKLKDYSTKISKKQTKISKLKKSLTNTVKLASSKSIAIGKSVKLTAKKAKSESYNTITWSSSDKKIATVDQKGNVKAVTGGAVTITAKMSISGKKATCKVTCYEPATSITLSTDAITLKRNEEYKVTATLNPASNEKITWSSSDEDVAEVSSNGTITAYYEGTAKITAKTANGVKASLVVTVVEDEEDDTEE